jgi:uncharacterized protein YoxC
VNLKLELESALLEVQTKVDEVEVVSRTSAIQIEKLTSELQEARALLDSEEKRRVELVGEKEAELESLLGRLVELEGVVQTLNQEMEASRVAAQKEETEREERIKRIEDQHELAMCALRKELQEEKEQELKDLREKGKAEFEGLRSRYRLMSSVSGDQRSPSENVDVRNH